MDIHDHQTPTPPLSPSVSDSESFVSDEASSPTEDALKKLASILTNPSVVETVKRPIKIHIINRLIVTTKEKLEKSDRSLLTTSDPDQLSKEREKNEKLRQNLNNLVKNIEELERLPSADDLELDLGELDKSITHLLSKNEFSDEELELIHTLKYTLDELANESQPSPKQTELKQFIKDKVDPLFQKWGENIRKKKQHSSAVEAAAKGHVLEVLVPAEQKLAAENRPLRQSGVSQQEVFLLPEEKLVLKRSQPRATEEEYNVNNILALMREGTAVPSLKVSSLNPERHGASVDPSVFQVSELFPTAKTKIEEKLSEGDKQKLHTSPSDEKANYEMAKNQTWYLQIVNPPWNPGAIEQGTFSFQTIKNNLAILGDPANVSIGTDPNNLTPLPNHIAQSTSLMRAIRYQEPTESEKKQETEKQNYEEQSQKTWYIQVEGEGQPPMPISFNELKLFEVDGKKLDDLVETEKVLIGSTPESVQPYNQHVKENSSFFRALQYVPPETHAFFKPDINPITYNEYSKYQWTYEDESGIHTVSFHELQKAYLENPAIQNKKPVPDQEGNSPDLDFLDAALDCDWSLGTPQLMATAGPTAGPLQDVEAKPFLDDMIMMSALNRSPQMREFIRDRLTEDAKFDSVSTAMVQLLDLHHNNLAVIPVGTEEYNKFKNFKYKYKGNDIEFTALHQHYMKDDLDPTDEIEYIDEKGVKVKKQFAELNDLKNAFNTPWKFAIFDTDYSLAEDNRTITQIIGKTEGHLVPLRSILLETDFKDLPFSEETIDRLLDSTERDARIRDWAKRGDAPVRQRFSPETEAYVDQTIEPLLREFSLGDMRKKQLLKNDTFNELQGKFAKRLKDLSFLPMWEKIEESYNTIPIKEGDTLESIALAHRMDVEKLRALNPGLDLIPGNKIKIASVDLTSEEPKAIQARKKISKQLFPRLSYGQQQALIERQDSLFVYLSNWKTINSSQKTGPELIVDLKKFLDEAPFDTLTRKSYLDKLDDINVLNDPAALNKLKKEICDASKPTYFNVTKVLYPLLADAYTLVQYARPDYNPGHAIGLFQYTLEELIDEAIKKTPVDQAKRELAEELRNRVNASQNNSFFMHM